MTSKAQTSLRVNTRVNQESPRRGAATETNMTTQTPSRRGSRVLFFGLIGLALVGLTGCVSSGKYEALISERDKLLEEQASLSLQVADTKQQQQAAALTAAEALAESERQKQAAALKADEARAEIERQQQVAALKAAAAQAEIERQQQVAALRAAAAQAEIERQQQVHDNLQATFAKEQRDNQIKIEMMKSGVKVNLANEILFPSGSANLNDSGVEVLTRAAAELKKSPYQAVVAGFTDDITISGKLTHKYPTNWELAGARAASVVRLLEQEGVAPAQLLAISFGQNNPVQPNDTSEGRSKNRRIEIILRPVPVTMD